MPVNNYNIEPDPSSILGSLRSIGYNLETALADIIDNSIAADATIIEICNNDISDIPTEKASLNWLAILDNGNGMNIEGIVEALKLGGKGINQIRNEHDLGRFGLGLKTASLSQCKKLTVISKTDTTEISSLSFDLDYIQKNNKWEVFSVENKEVDKIINEVKERIANQNIFNEDSWTLIFWEKFDKFQIKDKNNFYSSLNKVRLHLSLIYHKFNDKIQFILNTTEIDFWNPYATANSDEMKILKFSERTEDTFELRCHILKHRSEFINETEYNNQFKIGTPNQNQGFFVYRNNRLIFKGTWLGIYNNEHHYILARVEIHLSNSISSDKAWDINISKSEVKIPEYAKNDITTECNSIRSRANDTFRFHGGVKKHRITTKKVSKPIAPIWKCENIGNKEGSKDYYSINLENPIIKNYIELIETNTQKKEDFIEVLKFIQNYLPLDNIFSRRANNEVEQININHDDIYLQFKKNFILGLKSNMEFDVIFNLLINNEPFNSLSFDDSMLKELHELN